LPGLGAVHRTECAGGSGGPKLAEEEFKNIQALKGIPADQLIPSMQFIAASLGVECEFCHVAHANEKDDKSQSHRPEDDQYDDGDQ